jgi:PAS domain S-box-containing protein
MTSLQYKAKPSRDAIESARRLEGIVASAIDAIVTVDEQQRMMLFNPAAERMFGISADEALGQYITRFIPEQYWAAHAAHIRDFTSTDAAQRLVGSVGAISGLRADGREFPIEASISQTEVNGQRLSTVILRDITERKAAETALLESQQRMEGIVTSAMDALIAVNDQQQVILFNPAAERMFGVTAGHAIGASIDDFIPERFRARHAHHIRRFKKTGVTNRRTGALGAIIGLRANGEEFPLEASISQIEIGGARIATVILRDITERKANEEALLLLTREVDHRAKNALAVVQALVSMTQAATKEEYIAAVRGRVSALGRAHSMLAQNRWEGADLMQIITDESAAYQKSGQLRLAGPPITMTATAVQSLGLVINELATNALKYGALSLDSGRVEVDWRVLPEGELELRWTEIGGPRVAKPTSIGFGSTLIEEVTTQQLGGRLDLDWRVEGLRFVATLPATVFRSAIAHGRVAEDTTVEPVPAIRAGRVLVVEDETLIAMDLCKALKFRGWEIAGPAPSIAAALRLLSEGPLPDAAVLDVNLNGMPVYPLAERLQALGVPLVFCTGYEQLDESGRYHDCPIIRKPMNHSLLDVELRRLRRAA